MANCTCCGQSSDVSKTCATPAQPVTTIGVTMRIHLAFTAAAIALAGCASTSIPTAEALPARIVLNQEITKPSDGAAELVLKRDSGGPGVACMMIVGIDGREVAELRPAEMVRMYPQPGAHILSARLSGRGLCGSSEDSVDVNASAGKVRAYRTYTDPSGMTRIRPTMD